MSTASTTSSPSTTSTSPSQSTTYIALFNDEDYKLEKTLYQGKQSNVFKATDNVKQLSVIIKIHNVDLPSTKLRNKFIKEFENGTKCNEAHARHIIKYYDLKKVGRRLAVIMEDFEAISLVELLAKNTAMELTHFLKTAIQLVEALAEIHQAGITHQTICPRHILLNNESGRVKLIDFGLSSLLNKQYQPVINPKNFEQNLEYISPEQTGRMNKDVDFRTDFYSLGVVLYQMICGVVPFSTTDPAKLIYAHIAKNPTPPHLVVKSIPQTVSNIIMKLLSKNADERYQSSFGIKMDLKSCLMQWEQTRSISSFQIAKHDVHSTFHICQKLYGREEEVRQLLDSFEEVTTGQISSNLLLVYGYSGIGKSSLINELHKPLVRDKGYFISGKFDQFKRNIPYSSLIQAFQQLILTLLTEPEEKVTYWKNSILKVLGQKGQIIIDVIPELQNLIGPQLSVPELPPAENQNRFKKLFLDLINVFAKKSHPLILFLDDLQWADLPTLLLLESILLNPETQYLLVIGAYRDNEVSEAHPLTLMLNKIEKKKPVKHIALQPLQFVHINQLLADTLNTIPDKCKELAAVVTRRTQGNPFFTIIFLQSLFNDGLISFNNIEGRWEWDTHKISSSGCITDTVIEMMTQRLLKLCPETQNVLSLAASIGNKFELKVLSLVYGKSMQSTGRDLWPAVKDGLILQFGEEFNFALCDSDYGIDNISYQFLHDRVQQSAYELVGRSERQKLHLKIGRLLAENTSPDQLDDKLFDVMAHFRVAFDLLDDPVESLKLARLFLRASIRAKDSSAYAPACDYALSGIQLLPEDHWNTEYELTLSLYKELAEGEYMRGNFDYAESLYPQILKNCKTLTDKTSVNMITVNQYELQQRYVELYDLVCNCLVEYNVHFPKERSEILRAIEDETKHIDENLNGRLISDLVNNPEMTDTFHLDQMKLLCCLWAPLYCVPHMALLTLISLKMANHTIQHGNCILSTIAYSSCSFALNMWLGEVFKAVEFGKISVQLLDIYPHEPFRGRTLMVYGIGACLSAFSLAKSIPVVDKGFEMALEHGDLPFASYSAHHMISQRYYNGENLGSVHKVYERNMPFLKKTNVFIYYYAICITQAMRAHMCLPEDVEEVDLLEKIKDADLLMGVFYAGKLQRLFWENRDWLEISYYADLLRTDKYTECMYGLYMREETNFMIALAYMHALDDIEEEERRSNYSNYTKKVIERFKKLSADCPTTNLHKLLILKAERALRNKKTMKAIKLYDQAILEASKANFLQYEAYANEQLGKLWNKEGMSKYSKTHVQEAYYLYNEWGSKLKLQYLKKACWKDVLDLPGSQLDQAVFSPNLSTPMSASSWLMDNHYDFEMEDSEHSNADDTSVDLLTVMKASKAISMEQNLEEFLDNMMKIIIENSCATKGVFLLEENDGELLVVAEGTADSVMIDTIRAIPLTSSSDYPYTIINYVARTKEMVILGDCSARNQFDNDPHLAHVKSVLCAPILKQKKFKGVIYLENNLLNDAFSEKRAKVIGILSAQMALLLENAKFSALLESEKKYRTLAAELAVVKKRLEEFIDVLCHELRNPLAGIAGSNEAMNELISAFEIFLLEHNYLIVTEPNQEYVREHMKEVKDILKAFSISSQHLKDIVDTVLTVSMLENQNVKLQAIPFNPSEMLNNVTIMFKAKLGEKRLGLVTEFPDEEHVVVGDPYRFKEIVINLLSNAVKFTESGYIAIRYRCTEKTEDHTSFEFEIEDTGIGMTQIERAKLFRAFSQANSQTYAKYGGSGLGLKISKQIIELMGGTIRVQSEKDKGSKFVFHIQFKNPTAEDIKNGKESKLAAERKSTTPRAKKRNSDTDNKIHVLIAEDNSINAKLLKRLVEKAGNTCEVAMNGLEAVQLYTAFDKKYDIILMDLEMPVMSGLEATQAIREEEKRRNLPATVIVGVSANARGEFEQTAFAAGMQDFVKKPYLAHDILATIDKWTGSSSPEK